MKRALLFQSNFQTPPHFIALLCLLLSLAAITAQAGETEERKWPLVDGSNHIALRSGLDPAMGITLGYGREFNWLKTNRHWLMIGEWETPFATFGQNGAVRFIGALPIVRAKRFRFSGEVGLETGWTHNRNYKSVRIAPGAALLVGIGGRDDRWYVDGEFGYQRAIANHIAHTDFYQDVFYKDAKDGWYQGTAGHFRMGLRTGFRLHRWNIELRASHVRSERFRSTMGSPLMATLGVGVRF